MGKRTWEKGPTTEPRTCDPRSNAVTLATKSATLALSHIAAYVCQCSVVGPFSHVLLLSCVVSSTFEQLVPAQKLHILNYTILTSVVYSLYLSVYYCCILLDYNVTWHICYMYILYYIYIYIYIKNASYKGLLGACRSHLPDLVDFE